MVCRSHDKESRRHGIGILVRIHDVTRNLTPNKLIIGHVSVQGPHHPIAITPRPGKIPAIEKATEPITVAGHIEPVASPTFAVLRGLQKGVNDLGKRLRPIVVEETSTCSGVGGKPTRSR